MGTNHDVRENPRLRLVVWATRPTLIAWLTFIDARFTFYTMRTTHTADQVFGTRSRVAVLRVLWRADGPLNTSEIARRTHLTRPAAAAALEALSWVGVVRSTTVGRTIVHELDRGNAFTEAYVTPVLSAEDTLTERMLAEIRERFEPHAESAVLFGSYARGEQVADSDVDVVLVSDAESEKSDLDAAVLEYEPEFERRWGSHLSVLTYTAREARSLFRSSPALEASLREQGLVIFGRGAWEWPEDE